MPCVHATIKLIDATCLQQPLHRSNAIPISRLPISSFSPMKRSCCDSDIPHTSTITGLGRFKMCFFKFVSSVPFLTSRNPPQQYSQIQEDPYHFTHNALVTVLEDVIGHPPLYPMVRTLRSDLSKFSEGHSGESIRSGRTRLGHQ
jgi:hypothetical protein